MKKERNEEKKGSHAKKRRNRKTWERETVVITKQQRKPSEKLKIKISKGNLEKTCYELNLN
jgi:hypothetical protein